MFAARVRGAMMLGLAAIVAACGSSGGTDPGGGGNTTTPAAVSVVSGNGQTGFVGTALSLPLVVKVTTASGAAVKGASVAFAVTTGAASVSPSTATTDSTGVAQTLVTLGASAGSVTITATVVGTSLTATFSATAGSGTITGACSSTSPATLALGEVRPGLSGTGICLSGGAAGSDYALVTFNSNPDTLLAQASFTVKSTGANALSTPDVASANLISTPFGSQLRASTSANVRAAFEETQRRIAEQELAPRMAAARATYRKSLTPSGARFNSIPANLTVGQTITLNANGNSACSNIINVRARVVSISNTAIVLADSLNPSGGFTDAEYASFGTTFDTLITPLDTTNFGQPSDIDKNGKVLILFTKEVNKLTPRGSAGFIGGFFFERDLFPQADDRTTGLQGCAGSNVGEMFYVLVPDPTAIFADTRTKADVQSNTVGTLAHEFQHLINAGRRIYVNNADDFESVWLNEGLSHIAEELLYYREAGKAPRQNISATDINNSAQVAAFNEFQSDNFGRYEVFLGKPSQTSVYGNNDELETRGATWNLLRYLADHQGTSDGTIWRQLVNSTTSGQKNLANVFGSTWLTQVRDWATSVFSDDVAGVSDARFLEPSWNMRSIYPRLSNGSGGSLGKFPLTVVPLSDAAPANLGVVAGGAAYVRFTVPAGGQASIDWSAGSLPVSSLVQFTLVRTR